mmetsp:Transcript_39778/g.40268  ORF Transcript_39778/g.40268 Transcript_39778/m.40268 type:complete len:102 (-) Transcript_39778:517-822(-)
MVPNCNNEAERFTVKMCTACRSAWYCCNVDGQKKHRTNQKHQRHQDVEYFIIVVDFSATTRNRREKTDDGEDDDDYFSGHSSERRLSHLYSTPFYRSLEDK